MDASTVTFYLGNIPIKNKDLGFIFALKSNRRVSLKKKEFIHVQALDIPNDGQTVWLREFGFIKAFRTTLKNKQRHYALYLADEMQLDKVKQSDSIMRMINIDR